MKEKTVQIEGSIKMPDIKLEREPEKSKKSKEKFQGKMKELFETYNNTKTYGYKDGFIVDVVSVYEEPGGERWDIWLYHKDCDYKKFLFDIPYSLHYSGMEDVLEIIVANLEENEYIEEYKKQFMDVAYEG